MHAPLVWVCSSLVTIRYLNALERTSERITWNSGRDNNLISKSWMFSFEYIYISRKNRIKYYLPAEIVNQPIRFIFCALKLLCYTISLGDSICCAIKITKKVPLTPTIDAVSFNISAREDEFKCSNLIADTNLFASMAFIE